MITLKITRKDGSTHWTEYFNYKADADRWLTVEKTRPYWEPSFSVSFSGKDFEMTPEKVMDPVMVAKAKDYLSTFDPETYDPAEAGELFNYLLIVMGIK